MKSFHRVVNCFVPGCCNCSESGGKLFFQVPRNSVRNRWWLAVGLPPDTLQPQTKAYCCEDHFNLEEDVEEWRRYLFCIEGGLPTFRLRLHQDVIPHRNLPVFSPKMPTPKRRKTVLLDRSNSIVQTETSSPVSLAGIKRNRLQDLTRISNIQEGKDFALAYNPQLVTYSPHRRNRRDSNAENVDPNEYIGAVPSTLKINRMTRYDLHPLVPSSNPQNEDSTTSKFSARIAIRGGIPGSTENVDPHESVHSKSQAPLKMDVGCQTMKRMTNNKFRSVGVSVAPSVKDAETNTDPIAVQSSSSSAEESSTEESKSSNSVYSLRDRADPTYQPSDGTFTSSSSVENLESDFLNAQMLKQALNLTVMFIENNPKLYLGVDPSNMKILKELSKFSNIQMLHIYVVLRKIRLNESNELLSDAFSCSKSTICRAINDNLVPISEFLSTFIFWPSKELCKRNVPLAFRANYSNVEAVIDCFEIEIEKPGDSEMQSLTWSDYYKCNTVKFLVSSSPCGFINFISLGYGGRASDLSIVEKSKFLDKLEPNTYVLADRGFKQIETLLHERDCHLIRPPSVKTDEKMTKEEVKTTRIIASLRIHIERVIRRIREYHFMAPHSRFHHCYIKMIDAVAVIVCALSNIQGPIVA